MALLMACALSCALQAQCPEFESTDVTPACNPSCELCSGDQFNINLKGNDLPNGGKVEFYINGTPGYNPYQGQGTLIGTSMITTPGGNCRICPELIGILIDACGTEQNNEFVVMWTGSGFNTSNFLFDYASQNNTGGAGNADIGGGCSVQAGGAGLIGGCMATAVGAGYNLPANAIWVVFCSSAASTSYDFSSVCGLGLKVFVSTSTCARSIGAFTNKGGTGTRTQGFSINGCSCGTTVTYDLMDPGMMGDGDAWAGGITNNGCSASISGAGNYVPAKSTITPFTYKIPVNWCDKTYEIVGIVNPKPDPMCCKEIFTDRITITVKCPVANKANLEVCDDGSGKGRFILEDAEPTILGGSGGTVEWFKDATGMMKIMSPYVTSTTTVYARIREGNCVSPLVPVELKVTPFTGARSTSDEKCADKDGYATFVLINLENFIKNGNNSVNVKFYEDINKTTLIVPPLRINETTTIYAATCKGDCESPAVPVKLIVNPLPEAKDLRKLECPESDGKANFDLNLLIPAINDSMRNNTVTFFKDSTLKDTVFSPYRTDSSILYAVVRSAKCSNVSKVTLIAGKLTYSGMAEAIKCKDASGKATFDLNEISLKIQGGDTMIKVQYYWDSTRNNPVMNPVTIGNTTTIYAVYVKGTCISDVFEVRLMLVDQPLTYNTGVKRCSSPDGTYTFYTDSLKQLVNNQTGTETQFYYDLQLTRPVPSVFSSTTDTIYAVVRLGDCIASPVFVILEVVPAPMLYQHADTTSCTNYVLDSIFGERLTMSAAYYSMRNGGGQTFKPGDRIAQSGWIYRFDSNRGCAATDSFKISIQKMSNAGADQSLSVCDGSSIDLGKIIINADPGGVFAEKVVSGRLSGNTLNTTGASGKSFTIYYIVPSVQPCPPDTSVIDIRVVQKVSAGRDTLIDLCSIDSVDLNSLLRNSDPGGVFKDQAGKMVGPKIHASNYGFGLYSFFYTVGDGKTCPTSTSTISIMFHQTTIVDPIPDIRACQYYVLKPITGVNTLNRSGYFSLTGRRGKSYFNGDTIFTTTKLFATGTDLRFCTNEVSFNVIIGTENILVDSTTGHCPDYFQITGGQRFDINNPSGSIRLKSANPSECDTVLNVRLGFLAPSIGRFDTSLCRGSFVTVNGTVYDATNLSGTEVLRNVSAAGCDSIVNVSIAILEPDNTNFSPTLCDGDSVRINNRIYNAARPTGLETFVNQKGCDSIVRISLNFLPSARSTVTQTLCKNQRIVINGTTYDVNRPSGTEILRTPGGCDSTVSINLSFYPDAELNYNGTLCPGDSIRFGNVVLNSAQTNYSTTLAGASSNGCDSVVNLHISFFQPSRSTLRRTLCSGQSVIFNGHQYDELHPSGTDTLRGLGAYGCDSLVDVSLSFIQSFSETVRRQICYGDSILIGNKTYHADKTNGTDSLKTSAGCDSIVSIQVTILPLPRFDFDTTLCINDQVIINGQVYDRLRQVGLEKIKGAAANGCDSLVNVQIHLSEPKITVQSAYDISAGSNLQISIQTDFTPATIQWQPAVGLSCSDCLNPIASPENDIEYMVTMTDENGCAVTTRITIHVIKDIFVYVPNVFSPNGDNTNDYFEVFSNVSDVIIKTCKIFSRWGEEVYSVENLPLSGYRGWDGTFHGQKLNPGVYTYWLVLEKNGVERIVKGDLTLVR